MCHACNRRQFLEATAAGGMLAAGTAPGAIGSQVGRIANPSYDPVVRATKAGPGEDPRGLRGRPTGPGPSRTWTPRRNESCSTSVWRSGKKLGDVQFVGGELVGTPAEAAAVAAKLDGADALLLIHLTFGSGIF